MTWTFKLARRIASSRALIAATVLVASLTACGSDATGSSQPTEPTTPVVTPVAGILSVELSTPSNNDGAVQFQVTGPGVDSVRAVGYQAYGTSTGSSNQVIVTGQLRAGVVARVYVKDMARAGEYRVTIVAAAARGTYALQNLQGYSASLLR